MINNSAADCPILLNLVHGCIVGPGGRWVAKIHFWSIQDGRRRPD